MSRPVRRITRVQVTSSRSEVAPPPLHTDEAPHADVHGATAAALADLLSDPGLESRIVHVEAIPARPARHADPSHPLQPDVAAALAATGICRLYSHQAAALDLVRAGRSVALASGTASGKSLAYVVPALEAVRTGGTGLLLFPTKALARDQLRRLTALGIDGVEACVVDGDTPTEMRAWARRRANVILTNPDMLHQVLLPDHARWSLFFKHLRVIAVDEAHTLRGIFGSHVSHVMRRLRRVAAHHGSDPTFVCTSATLGDAAEVAHLCDLLTGARPEPILTDGSPRPPSTVLCWNPPFIDVDKGVRQSAVGESGRLLARLVAHGLQTLAFTSSRKAAEILATIARETLGDRHPRIVAYRGGYLAEERRDIEAGLMDGAVRGVAATNALELGMDVGTLDAAILCGFPGTVASFRQQMGRVGRGTRPGLGVLVAGPDQLDQWYVSHPHELFTRSCETAVINPGNPRVAEPHLACAAFEIPLRYEEPLLTEDMDVAAAPLVAAGFLRMRRNRLHWGWAGRTSPARSVGIRSSETHTVKIVDAESGRSIGTVDGARAALTVHPGAIYVHQGERWRVEDLDLDACVAAVVHTTDGLTTQPRTTTEMEILRIDTSMRLGRGAVRLALGDVETTRWVLGYRTVRTPGLGDTSPPLPAPSDIEVPFVPLDLPPRTMRTRALWFSVPDITLEAAGLPEDRVSGTVHACEHTGIGIMPRFAICDRWDLGGVSTACHPDTGQATWFVYDGYAGGAGLADAGYACGPDGVRAARDVIASCPCVAGCPSCIQSPKCGNWNEPLDKAGAIALLDAILASPWDASA
ncbi:MAG: DEAD/DEAH box helicase [Acidimicrobiia bacterium]|nr:DEAD/DEAH box helicase [Acidimicrobiia bacterium]